MNFALLGRSGIYRGNKALGSAYKMAFAVYTQVELIIQKKYGFFLTAKASHSRCEEIMISHSIIKRFIFLKYCFSCMLHDL